MLKSTVFRIQKETKITKGLFNTIFANRFYQALLILSTVGLSWLGMMAVHEFGHVLAAWSSGGVVKNVDLYPLGFSHTTFTANPCPLYVVWGGPTLGCLIPLLLLVIVSFFAKRCAYLATFFAGFCLVANGAYLAGGMFSDKNNLDDGAVIIYNGGQVWHLLLFALLSVSGGLWLLNGLGKYFGLSEGEQRGKVDRKVAAVVTIVFLVVFCIEFAVF